MNNNFHSNLLEHLKPLQKQLLVLIGTFGFVNLNQINMLWSVLNRKPSHLANKTLTLWKKKKIIDTLSPVDKRSKGLTHTAYFLNNRSVKFLIHSGQKVTETSHLSFSAHNEQAKEVVIQGLYQACFISNLNAANLHFLASRKLFFLKSHSFHFAYLQPKIMLIFGNSSIFKKMDPALVKCSSCFWEISLLLLFHLYLFPVLPKSEAERQTEEIKYILWKSYTKKLVNIPLLRFLPKNPFFKTRSGNLRKPLHQKSLGYLITNPHFKLNKYNLSSFAMRVSPKEREKALFYPDQIVTFSSQGKYYELYVELDNRTEGLETQMRKILNYLAKSDYIRDSKKKTRIMLLMVINDGSLKNKNIKNFRPVFRKIASEIQKIMEWIPPHTHPKYTLNQVYSWETDQFVLCITGLNEAGQDVADFLLNRSYLKQAIQNTKKVAQTIDHKSNWHVKFRVNPAIINQNHRDYWDNLDTNLGELCFNHKTKRIETIQPLYLEIEHSLNSFLRLKATSNSALIFPQRKRKLFVGNTYAFAKDNLMLNQSYFHPKQRILIQPVTGYNQSVQTLIWLNFLLKTFPNQIYSYFRTGAINKRYPYHHRNYLFDNINEYVNPSKNIDEIANILLAPYGVSVSDQLPTSYSRLHQLAFEESKKIFMKQVRVQDIPLRIYTDILINMNLISDNPPLGFYLPYLNDEKLFSTYRDKAIISIPEWLNLPDQVIPAKRTIPKIRRLYN